SEIRVYLENQNHIEMDPSPPYTQSLNGAGERSGGVIKDKARAIRISSKLPGELWPEIPRAAVYLHNRTPTGSILTTGKPHMIYSGLFGKGSTKETSSRSQGMDWTFGWLRLNECVQALESCS